MPPTKDLIVTTALRLFKDKGYEATTMRAIASAAGVSLGNAYYYFSSKEHLVQAFYDQAQAEHARAAEAVLGSKTGLAERVAGVAEAWVDVMEPYRPFAASFFRNAADPTSPLSPFSTQSAPAREVAVDLWRRVVDGSDAKVPKVLRAELPGLLWLYFMGLVLYWVHDRAPGGAGTRLLARRTAPMVARAIDIARLPVARKLVRDVVDLANSLKAAADA